MKEFVLKKGQILPTRAKQLQEPLSFESLPIPDKVQIILYHVYENITGIPSVKVGDLIIEGDSIAQFKQFHFHASISGVITAISEMEVQILGNTKIVPYIEIKFSGKIMNWLKASEEYKELSSSKIIHKIFNRGVINLGYYPYLSLQEILSEENWETLVINALNLDVVNTVNSRLLNEKPEFLTEGIKILQKCFNLQKIIVLVNYSCSNTVKKQIMDIKNVKLINCRETFPLYDETLLLKKYLKMSVKTKQDFILKKIFVLNMITLKAIYQAVIFNKPLMSLDISIEGNGFQNKNIYNIRMGNIIKTIMNEFEFIIPLSKLSIGNFFSAWYHSDLNIPFMSFFTNLYLLSDDQVNKITRPSACINCSHCESYCPVKLTPNLVLEENLNYDLSACIFCGICDTVCPSEIPLKQLIFQNLKNKRDKND